MEYHKTSKKLGFTLVELLVVIAIIGILSSVVISSLGTARNRAANTAIKANLASVRSSIEIIYDNAQTYGTIGQALGTCPVALDTTIFGQQTVLDSITSALNASGAGGTTTCVSEPASAPVSSWAISIKLKAPEDIAGVTVNYWCVDNLANSKGEVADLSGLMTSCQ